MIRLKVEISTGSLGHGLSIATGMAIASKIKKKKLNTMWYVEMAK